MVNNFEFIVDPSLFLYHQDQMLAHLFVYINDIIIVNSNDKEVKCLIDLLSKEFTIRDLGDLKIFLEIQVNLTSEGLHSSQTQYLVNLLHSCDMENLKLVVPKARKYRCIVGSLLVCNLDVTRCSASS